VTRERAPLTKQEEGWLRTSMVAPRLAERMARGQSYLSESELASIGHAEEWRLVSMYDSSTNVPFEAFTFKPVRRRMQEAISRARKKSFREQAGLLDASYEVLDREIDRGDIFNDTREDAIEHLGNLVCGMMTAVLGQFMSQSSHDLGDEAALAEKVDQARKDADVRATIAEMGETGEVLKLRWRARCLANDGGAVGGRSAQYDCNRAWSAKARGSSLAFRCQLTSTEYHCSSQPSSGTLGRRGRSRSPTQCWSMKSCSGCMVHKAPRRSRPDDRTSHPGSSRCRSNMFRKPLGRRLRRRAEALRSDSERTEIHCSSWRSSRTLRRRSRKSSQRT
jgi:hypothetical protein